MTYFGFLLRFVLPPILLLGALAIWDTRSSRSLSWFQQGQVVRIIMVHVLLALVYTTPWDNYLVASGVWWYNPQLVSGVVFGWVPLEEYTFFVLETVLSALLWLALARRLPPPPSVFRPNQRLVRLAAGSLVVVWLVFAVLFFAGPPALNYLSITLFWALPAIFPQFLFGADILWHYRRLVLSAVLLPGIYLSLTDILALRAGTWSISPAHTSGLLFFGILPLEEVVFFFITNALIAFGLTLMLSSLSQQRVQSWRAAGFKGLPWKKLSSR